MIRTVDGRDGAHAQAGRQLLPVRLLSDAVPSPAGSESLGMELRQQIMVDKGLRTVAGRATRGYKMFPTVTESILFLYRDPKPFVRKFLKERQRTLGLDTREINERLGVKSNDGGMWSIFTGANVCAQMPTEDIWNRLERILDFCCPYRSIAQTWHVQPGLGDVWHDIDFYGDKPRLHPTRKPPEAAEVDGASDRRQQRPERPCAGLLRRQRYGRRRMPPAGAAICRIRDGYGISR